MKFYSKLLIAGLVCSSAVMSITGAGIAEKLRGAVSKDRGDVEVLEDAQGVSSAQPYVVCVRKEEDGWDVGGPGPQHFKCQSHTKRVVSIMYSERGLYCKYFQSGRLEIGTPLVLLETDDLGVFFPFPGGSEDSWSEDSFSGVGSNILAFFTKSEAAARRD